MLAVLGSAGKYHAGVSSFVVLDWGGVSASKVCRSESDGRAAISFLAQFYSDILCISENLPADSVF